MQQLTATDQKMHVAINGPKQPILYQCHKLRRAMNVSILLNMK